MFTFVAKPPVRASDRSKRGSPSWLAFPGSVQGRRARSMHSPGASAASSSVLDVTQSDRLYDRLIRSAARYRSAGYLG
jgi:hypothetical protein